MATNSVFSDRLTAVREERGIKRQKAADDLGITRASLEYYEKGMRKPDTEMLLKICEYYKVSADYLLGLSNAQITATDDEQLKTVCDYTGLSEKSVKGLKVQRKKGLDYINTVFSFMLENQVFFTIAWKVAEYRKYKKAELLYLDKAIKAIETINTFMDEEDIPDEAVDNFVKSKEYEAQSNSAIYYAQNMIHIKGVAYLPENTEIEYELKNTQIYRSLEAAYNKMVDNELTATTEE